MIINSGKKKESTFHRPIRIISLQSQSIDFIDQVHGINLLDVSFQIEVFYSQSLNPVRFASAQSTDVAYLEKLIRKQRLPLNNEVPYFEQVLSRTPVRHEMNFTY